MSTLDDARVPAAPVRQPRGCLFYVGITSIVLLLVLGIGGYFVIRYALDSIVDIVEPYTEATAMRLPESTMPEAEYQALERRVREFGDAANAQRESAPLVLTGDDLNALIANHPAWILLRDKVHVSLVGDQMTSEIAFPLDDLVEHLPRTARLQGRFFNAHATLAVSLVDGNLMVSLRSLELNGKQLPADLMASLRAKNLAEGMQHDGTNDDLRHRIEMLRIEDGKLTIKAASKK